MEDMPIASPKGSDAAALEKAEAARVKIMRRVLDKYLVRFEPLLSPTAPLERDGRLAGLVFQKNRFEGGALIPTDERVTLEAPLVVSSIGSVPEPIDGIPRRGELYDFDRETGAVRGLERVYGLGNVLTGKGNIRDSRQNATQISASIAERLLGVGDALPCTEEARSNIRERANAIAGEVNGHSVEAPEALARIRAFIEARWLASGYEGDYRSYIARSRRA